jgi:hypothetical protein
MHSAPITTNVLSSNPAHDEIYSIQHYVIKFVSDFRQADGILGYFGFLHQLNWSLRYSWNIVDSGVKHNCPNSNPKRQPEDAFNQIRRDSATARRKVEMKTFTQLYTVTIKQHEPH